VYALETRVFLLRGQYEKAAKRLNIIASAYDDLEFAPLGLQQFKQELLKWCNQADRAYLLRIRAKEAAEQSMAQALIEKLWNDEQYLGALTEGQDPNAQKQKKDDTGAQTVQPEKTILAVALLTVLKDSLGEEACYLQSQNSQERTERSQASWQRLTDAGEAVKARKVAEHAQESWQATAGWWRKYVERYSFDPGSLPARLKAIREMSQRGEIRQVTSDWNQLLTEVHRSAAARLNLARALENGGGKDAALQGLTELVKNLGAFRTNPELQPAIAEFTARALAASMSKEFVESMARDLGPQGGFQALEETAQLRIRQVNAK
jgi:hypothetical protein